MHHKNPDCGNVEIGSGNCPRCWRDTFTCDDKGHHFAENSDICDCRKTTRYADECGFEKWTDCEKHGAQKGLHCPQCEMVKVAGIAQMLEDTEPSDPMENTRTLRDNGN